MGKKFFSLVVLVIAMCTMFVACGQKKSTEVKNDIVSSAQIGNGFTLIAKNVNYLGEKVDYPIYGVQKDGKDIIEANYKKIEFDKELQIFKCYSLDRDNDITLITQEGKKLREGNFTEVTLDEDKAYYRFKEADGKIGVYSNKGKTSWGMYDDVVTTDYFIFKKVGEKWGLVTITGEPYWDTDYDKIYVINYKSEKEYDVVMLSGGTWELCNQSKEYYDASQTEIKNLVKKAKDSVGVLNVKW